MPRSRQARAEAHAAAERAEQIARDRRAGCSTRASCEAAHAAHAQALAAHGGCRTHRDRARHRSIARGACPSGWPSSPASVMSSARRPRHLRRNCRRKLPRASPTPNGSASSSAVPRPRSSPSRSRQLRAQLDALTRALAAEQPLASERAGCGRGCRREAAARAGIERMRAEGGRRRRSARLRAGRELDRAATAPNSTPSANEHGAHSLAAARTPRRPRSEAAAAKPRFPPRPEMSTRARSPSWNAAWPRRERSPPQREIPQRRQRSRRLRRCPRYPRARIAGDARVGASAAGATSAAGTEPRHAAQPGEPSFADLRDEPEQHGAEDRRPRRRARVDVTCRRSWRPRRRMSPAERAQRVRPRPPSRPSRSTSPAHARGAAVAVGVR